MKLMICVPHANPLGSWDWAHKLYTELIYPENTHIMYTCSLPIETARNQLVARSYHAGVTHILFIDDDIWPLKNDAVMTLLKHDKPIISGICRRRTPKIQYIITPPELALSNGLVEVDEIGAGFLLIDMVVIETIAFHHNSTVGDFEFFKWAGSTQAPCSEDITFCRQAKKSGFKIYADTSVKCGHHDIVVYDDSELGFTPLRKGYKDEYGIEKINKGVIKKWKLQK